MSNGDETDTATDLIENSKTLPLVRWERLKTLCREAGDGRLEKLLLTEDVEACFKTADELFKEEASKETTKYVELFLQELERGGVIQKLEAAATSPSAQPTNNRPAALTIVRGGALPRTPPPPPKAPAKREGLPPPPGPPTGGAETVRYGGLPPASPPPPTAPKPQATDAEDGVNLAAETRRLNTELTALNTVTFEDQALAGRIKAHRLSPQTSHLPDNLATWNREATELLAAARTTKRNVLAAGPPSRRAVPSGVTGATPAAEETTSVSPTTTPHGGALAGPVAKNPPRDDRHQAKVIVVKPAAFEGAAKGAVLSAQSHSGDEEAEGPRTIPSPRPVAQTDQRWTALPPATTTKTRLGTDQPGSGGKIIFALLAVVALITIIAGAWWYRNRQPATTDEPPPISLPTPTAAPTATPVLPKLPSTTRIAPNPSPTASGYHTPNDLPPKVVRRGRTICPNNAPTLSALPPTDRQKMVKVIVAATMTVAEWPPKEDPMLREEDFLFCENPPPYKGQRRDVSACQVCRAAPEPAP